MYENMQQAQGGPDMSNMGGAQEAAPQDNGGADDVVDGDYREV